jgi:arylsulfatase A-like enzyme
MKTTLRRLRSVLLIVVGASALAGGGTAWARPPRLTLFVTVDSLGTDQLQRMRPRLRGGGFNQLFTQGAFFPNGRVEYAEAVTAPGHATLVTGCNPWRHGVVGNGVLNRQSGKLEPVFHDPEHPALESPLGVSDVSPANLLAETLADRLRLFTQERGKAVAIAAKSRSAIAMGGRLGQAWWFSEPVGKFVTGTWYTKELPGWVKGFNEQALPDRYFGKEWLLSEKKEAYLGGDDRPFEALLPGTGRAFPHVLTGGLTAAGPQFYAALAFTPAMGDLTVQLARAAIEGEQLGKDDIPDALFVSFSNTDRISHYYGPYSWEAQDSLLRVDKALGELIGAAERAAGGRANLLVVVTADHGAPAVAEEWAAAGLPGARLNPVALAQGVAKELSAKLGGEVTAQIEELDVYLGGKLLAEKRAEGPEVRREAARWLARQPGVAFAVARDDLEGTADPQGYLRALRVGFHPERSGDVLYVPRPFTVISTESTGTNHGSPYAYDTQVPVLISGRGVKAGVYQQDFPTVDVAPTVAALMEMGAPASAEGRVRTEALSTAPGGGATRPAGAGTAAPP